MIEFPVRVEARRRREVSDVSSSVGAGPTESRMGAKAPRIELNRSIDRSTIVWDSV